MMNANSWRFLKAEAAANYIDVYERYRQQDIGPKTLVEATTERQFRTAADILDRLNGGRKGILLADDVGLGKTTVATLCALVIAGKQGRVRILAPNEMMARRWRKELKIHVDALARFAPHLNLAGVQSTPNINLSRLNKGQIAVSTHAKATQLTCDLLIVDEVHRTRSEKSPLASLIKRQRQDITHLVVLTATPFSIDPRDLGRLLTRIEAGAEVIAGMSDFAKRLDALWKGKATGEPAALAAALAKSARDAVEAMKPYIIRHGIDDLTARERSKFGEFEVGGTRSEVGADMLEVMLRADRALNLGLQTSAWSKKRRNDPRYHVARGKLVEDLTELETSVRHLHAPEALYAATHAQQALLRLKKVRVHPKIEATATDVQAIVDRNEKVLVFCDHHLPASELATVLAARMRRPALGIAPDIKIWMAAWDAILPALPAGSRRDASIRRQAFIDWLCSDGMRCQIGGWLTESLRQGLDAKRLKAALQRHTARNNQRCQKIATHAIELYQQLTEVTSGSTRAQLLRGDAAALPGACMANVCAVCNIPIGATNTSYFFQNQPDTVLAIFNSPFGPDVLIATDKLSEGVDLHRFCRHLIHHELDPSPVRTVQRNGRLRRVDSWAARMHEPIVVSYPAMKGTRDERAVEIMQVRLQQFDLLLGGVGQDIDPDESAESCAHTLSVLREARGKMGRLSLRSPLSRK